MFALALLLTKLGCQNFQIWPMLSGHLMLWIDSQLWLSESLKSKDCLLWFSKDKSIQNGSGYLVYREPMILMKELGKNCRFLSSSYYYDFCYCYYYFENGGYISQTVLWVVSTAVTKSKNFLSYQGCWLPFLLPTQHWNWPPSFMTNNVMKYCSSMFCHIPNPSHSFATSTN